MSATAMGQGRLHDDKHGRRRDFAGGFPRGSKRQDLMSFQTLPIPRRKSGLGHWREFGGARTLRLWGWNLALRLVDGNDPIAASAVIPSSSFQHQWRRRPKRRTLRVGVQLT